ncbi:MAG: signal peptidase I [Candidatus Bathyarchaeia archaeon]
MTTSTLGKFWKNEYFQTAVTIILIVALVFGFWYGLRLALNTDTPALSVVSGSMLPTLNIGDLIIVQAVPPSQIYANYVNGDVVVFKSPSTQELIVHRAVRSDNSSGVYIFHTHGDNNPPGSEEQWDESRLVGKVIARIPYAGNIALLMHTEEYVYLIIFVIIILTIVIVILPATDKEKNNTSEREPAKEKRKIFGKLSIDTIYLIIINLLVISFIAFNIWGAFTFWQPGAIPPQNVTVHGMYPDLQFHESYQVQHNVSSSSLSSGLLTYRVDSMLNDGSHIGIRLGIQTLSFAQIAIILLALFDVWKLVEFMRLRSAQTQRVDSKLS